MSADFFSECGRLRVVVLREKKQIFFVLVVVISVRCELNHDFFVRSLDLVRKRSNKKKKGREHCEKKFKDRRCLGGRRPCLR